MARQLLGAAGRSLAAAQSAAQQTVMTAAHSALQPATAKGVSAGAVAGARQLLFLIDYVQGNSSAPSPAPGPGAAPSGRSSSDGGVSTARLALFGGARFLTI